MNHNSPLLSGLQTILAVLSLGLLLAGLAFWLAGAPEIWLEIALRSGLSACCAAAALTGAFLLCGGLNRRRGQAEWRMARCGLGDYLFPAAAALLCLMSSALILPHWREAWQMFLAGEMVFQLLLPWLAGLGGFFFLLWLQSKRVFFGPAGLRVCRLLGRPVEILWPQVKKIALEQQRGYPVLKIDAAERTYRFPSRTLRDGWLALLTQTLQAAQQYEIPAEGIKQSGGPRK